MRLLPSTLRATGAAILATAILVTGCKDGGTAPPSPKSVESVVGNTPTSTAGLVVTTAPTFSVKDGSGNILGGVAVTVAVTSGGGTLANAPTSTVAGAPTPVGTWTLGGTAGVNTVTVTVGGLTPLVITVTGVAGPPASVAFVAGASQSALAGTNLPIPLAVQVRDQFNNGVAGSTVTFQVTGGAGVVTPSTVTSDATGTAGGAVWRIGKSAIVQQVLASSGPFNALVTATVATSFDVDLRFFGPAMPPEAEAAFENAAARIKASIIGDVPDIDIPTLSGNAGIDISDCGPTGIVVNEIVDDVLIYATVVSIDGAGKILASAGPCVVRSTGRFTVVGVMRFDADDIGLLVSTGRLNDVVLHEMMHVVGVGTNWTTKALLNGGGTSDPRFVGPLGMAGCNNSGGSTLCVTGIPVENSGGAGTADSHWRESIFDSELMTGFVEAQGVPIPLSNMTIQSLADEGYVVNGAAADPYTVPGSAIRSLRAADVGTNAAVWETAIRPVFEITRSGVIRRVEKQ